eukprot:437399_1
MNVAGNGGKHESMKKRSRSTSSIKRSKSHGSNWDKSSVTSDNEFAVDNPPVFSLPLQDQSRSFDPVMDVLSPINDEKQDADILNEEIVYSSLIKTYKPTTETYIDVACILTPKQLYFASAMNYKIWAQLRDRTKINEIINIEKKNMDIKIDKATALKLASNLDIICDTYNLNIISDYFKGKTKNEIKKSILLNKNPIKSITDLFNGINRKDAKCVKYIKISKFYSENIQKNINVNKLLPHIFNGIVFSDAKRLNDSLIITLPSYQPSSKLTEWRKRRNDYLSSNHFSILKNEIKLSSYRGNETEYIHSELQVVDLSRFDMVGVAEVYKNAYGFIITGDRHELLCALDSNNIRHEWITHLDYAILRHRKQKTFYHIKINMPHTKDKLINHVTDIENDSKNDDFTTRFNFGVYLNYWQHGFENSVVSVYRTLKDELLNNTIMRLSIENYYQLYEECLQLMKEKGYNIKAQNIGVNNTKFNIPKGTPITINHLISLKLYTDFGNIQNEFKKHCRKHYKNESINSFIKRNSQIAHWCRYLKESCTFYGKLMSKKDTFYCGLNRNLLFDSLKQNFECPISTTTNVTIANSFSDGGMLLQMKRADSKTRFFDVSWLSIHPSEQERLFMGSALT